MDISRENLGYNKICRDKHNLRAYFSCPFFSSPFDTSRWTITISDATIPASTPSSFVQPPPIPSQSGPEIGATFSNE